MIISDRFWDSEVIGVRVGEITDFNDTILDTRNHDYVYAKVSLGRPDLVTYLEDRGFRTVDVSYTLYTKEPPAYSPDSEVIIRTSFHEDVDKLVEIATSSFYMDRFHNDPFLPNGSANKIYSEWVKNGIFGFYGERPLVAEYRGDILGFSCYRVTGDNSGNIDLTALSMGSILNHKQFYVADLLIRDCAKRLFIEKGLSIVTTATQVNNLSSLASLRRCGFSIKSSYITLSWMRR